MNQESGFTLVELLVGLGILSTLYALSIQSYGVYTQKASYYVARQLMQDARTAYETGVSNFDDPPSSAAYVQKVQGPVRDDNVSNLLVGLNLPKKVKLDVAYDAECKDASCPEGIIVISHCNASQSVMWERFGDGTSILLEELPGGGCS